MIIITFKILRASKLWLLLNNNTKIVLQINLSALLMDVNNVLIPLLILILRIKNAPLFNTLPILAVLDKIICSQLRKLWMIIKEINSNLKHQQTHWQQNALLRNPILVIEILASPVFLLIFYIIQKLKPVKGVKMEWLLSTHQNHVLKSSTLLILQTKLHHLC